MKLRLIAVGTRMPSWVEAAVDEYSKRLPADFRFSVVEVPMAQRGKSVDLQRAMQKEGDAMLAALERSDHVVALDVPGRQLSTEDMARRIDHLRMEARDLALLVGGPDGLAAHCLARADERWSLSALTLPHPLVRVVVAEQVYRVWSLLNNHPYHRA